MGFFTEPYDRAAYLPRYRYMGLVQGLASLLVVSRYPLPVPCSRIHTSVGHQLTLPIVSTLCHLLIFHIHIPLLHRVTAPEYAPGVALQFLGIYIVGQARYLLSPLRGTQYGVVQRMGIDTAPCQGHTRAGYTGILPSRCTMHSELISYDLLSRAPQFCATDHSEYGIEISLFKHAVSSRPCQGAVCIHMFFETSLTLRIFT